eukprot:2870644-Pleurochrysis_carterae.AAC.1
MMHESRPGRVLTSVSDSRRSIAPDRVFTISSNPRPGDDAFLKSQTVCSRFPQISDLVLTISSTCMLIKLINGASFRKPGCTAGGFRC